MRFYFWSTITHLLVIFTARLCANAVCCDPVSITQSQASIVPMAKRRITQTMIALELVF